jgi:hypothetical protein
MTVWKAGRPVIHQRLQHLRNVANSRHLTETFAFQIKHNSPKSITNHSFRRPVFLQLRFIVIPPDSKIPKSCHDTEEIHMKIMAFADWLTRGGCRADKVSIAYLGGLGDDAVKSSNIRGLGLSASESIEQDEVVIALPISLHLNMVGSRLDPSKTSTIMNISSSIPEALWGVKLALVLHAARNDPGVPLRTCAGSSSSLKTAFLSSWFLEALH